MTKLTTQTLVKRLMEQDYCDLGAMVIHAEPNELRLLQKHEELVKELKDFEKKYSKPVDQEADAKSEQKVVPAEQL